MQGRAEGNKGESDALASLGVAAAAKAIRNREISSESYANALLQRARDYADLNSFITIDEDAVLQAARAADKLVASGITAPLLGVPVAVKDSYLTEGLRSTIGLSTLGHFVPEHDADSVQAIRDGGGIIFGKNNLVEMSFGLTGHNEAFGQAKNPHNVDPSPAAPPAVEGCLLPLGLCPHLLGATQSVRFVCLHRCAALSDSSLPLADGRAPV